MIRWEDLKRVSERRNFSKKTNKPPTETSNSNKPNPIIIKRKAVEEERWSTAEKAYKTWEERSKGFVDFANERAAALKEEAKRAKQRYAGVSFEGIQIDNRKTFSQRKPKIIPISPLDFSYRKLNRDDYRLYYHNFWEPTYLGFSLDVGGERVEISDKEGLTRALKEILLPQIKAERIERGHANIFDKAREFLWHGKELLKAESYEHSCSYKEEDYLDSLARIEDVSTWVRISRNPYDVKDMKSYRILNPFHKDNKDILDLIEKGFEFNTFCPPGNRGSSGRCW